MDEEKGSPVPSEAGRAGCTPAGEGCRTPTWRGWVLSILAAILLSVTATLLLGGSFAGRPEPPDASGAAGSGCGHSCCQPADPGK